MPRLHRLITVALLAWAATAFVTGSARAEAVGSAADWSSAVEAWTARAAKADPAASRHLCELYFDRIAGPFDAPNAAHWCRLAAESGDAAAMLRLGMMSLAGVGTHRDLDAAATLCARAAPLRPAGSAAFCLAAVAVERQRAGEAATATPPPAATTPDAAQAADAEHWRMLAESGSRSMVSRLCTFYFGADGGAFDAVKAAAWCRRAAGYGDADAMRRVGMMRLWNVGIERDSPQAEAICLAAEARQPAVSASFCVAAVREERRLAAAQASPARGYYTGPNPVSLEVERRPDALAEDLALETVHTTDSGLHYNCRDILRWARYETPEGIRILTPDTRAFGRLLVDFQPGDYAALDRAAVSCAAALASHDADGGDRRHLAEFRRMLPLLATAQHRLALRLQGRREDLRHCLEAMDRSHAAVRQYFSQTAPADVRSSDVFSCTEIGRVEPLVGDPLPATPSPAAGAVRR